jgi:O-antigen ligase
MDATARGGTVDTQALESAGARSAFAGLILFIAVVYSNPGNWADGLADIGFAKIAAGVAVLALAGSWLLYGRRLLLGGATGAALLGFFAVVGFSSLWSLWPQLSHDTFLDGLKYLAMFLVAANVIDSRRRLQATVTAIGWATAIPAIGCIWSWAHGEHLVDDGRAGWIGIFGNPNDLAYYLVVGIALTLGAREAASVPLRRAYVGLLVLLGAALVLTQSRGGLLAAGAVLLLWTLRSLARARSLVGVGLALACVLALGPSDVWRQRSESATAYGEDMSAEGRLDAWRTGMAMAAARPLGGVGAGTFMAAWPSYAPGDAGPARTAHNTFVQIVGELGLPALVLFLIALFTALLGLPSGAPPVARAVQCGLAGFAVCSVTGGLAFSWPLYLLLGAAVGARRAALPAT